MGEEQDRDQGTLQRVFAGFRQPLDRGDARAGHLPQRRDAGPGRAAAEMTTAACPTNGPSAARARPARGEWTRTAS